MQLTPGGPRTGSHVHSKCFHVCVHAQTEHLAEQANVLRPPSDCTPQHETRQQWLRSPQFMRLGCQPRRPWRPGAAGGCLCTRMCWAPTRHQCRPLQTNACHERGAAALFRSTVAASARHRLRQPSSRLGCTGCVPADPLTNCLCAAWRALSKKVHASTLCRHEQ